jgi:hypothetical protein
MLIICKLNEGCFVRGVIEEHGFHHEEGEEEHVVRLGDRQRQVAEKGTENGGNQWLREEQGNLEAKKSFFKLLKFSLLGGLVDGRSS